MRILFTLLCLTSALAQAEIIFEPGAGTVPLSRDPFSDPYTPAAATTATPDFYSGGYLVIPPSQDPFAYPESTPENDPLLADNPFLNGGQSSFQSGRYPAASAESFDPNNSVQSVFIRGLLGEQTGEERSKIELARDALNAIDVHIMSDSSRSKAAEARAEANSKLSNEVVESLFEAYMQKPQAPSYFDNVTRAPAAHVPHPTFPTRH